MADAEFLRQARLRQQPGQVIGDRHTVAMEEAMWQGLAMLTQIHGTSISEQVRLAVEARLLLHGIGLADGELVPVSAIAVAESRENLGP